MKGLLLKDWYVAWKSCKLHLAVVVFTIVLSLVRSIGMSYLVYAALFAGMIPIYTLSVDEKWEWSRYSLSLPYDRKDVVTAKYVFSVLCLGAAGALMLILWIARAAFMGGSLGDVLHGVAFMLAFGLVFPTFTLPFMFRFGVEKGRLVAMIGVGLMVGVIFGMEIIEPDDLENGLLPLAGALGSAAPLILLVLLILLFLSWRIAIRLYEMRDL